MKRFLSTVAALGLTALGTVAVAVPAHAAHAANVVTVLPSQSVQAAVDAAQPGDTIQLVAGVYQQSVQITTNDITLQGAGNGTGGTVLEPAAVPANNMCAQVPPDVGAHPGGGICVFGNFSTTTGAITSRVTGVHVTGIQLDNWPGDGVAVFASDHVHIDHVTAVNSGTYGFAVLASTNGALNNDVVNGIQFKDGSGMFLGDLPASHMSFVGNTVTNAKLGMFMQDVGDVVFAGNTATGNCVGALLLDDNQPDDGQPNVSGNIAILGNTLNNNNDTCPAVPREGQPTIQGTGLLMLGTSTTVIAGNTTNGNVGQQALSGGIVMDSGAPYQGLDESNDVIGGNSAHNNGPVDMQWDQLGTGISYEGNNCATSTPSGLCGS
ncbi:MAG TPA: right-handed parallel beta-helix repeat-containing protein [Pseudonocardiaceae bacterium]|jgi:hypothetical protein|nr:right-handed parallel beta-helix repeat-containing protein [Pseudonocardiaceae bacterium]